MRGDLLVKDAVVRGPSSFAICHKEQMDNVPFSGTCEILKRDTSDAQVDDMLACIGTNDYPGKCCSKYYIISV